MNWLKRLFSSRASSDAPVDVAPGTNEEIDINEARIDAGGGGALGFPGEPDSHASPGEQIADAESETN